MKLIKVLCTLFLLLVSSNCYSFFSTGPVDFTKESGYQIPSEFSEDIYFNFAGNLTTSIPVINIQFSAAYFKPFLTYSSLSRKFEKEEINYPKLIDPNFTIRDIIFPFHSFL